VIHRPDGINEFVSVILAAYPQGASSGFTVSLLHMGIMCIVKGLVRLRVSVVRVWCGKE